MNNNNSEQHAAVPPSSKNVRTEEFKKMFSRLPARVQRTAEKRFHEYFLKDPTHPLLERHNLHNVSDARRASFAVTIHYGYRGVAFTDEVESCNVWYWCGSHPDYDDRFRQGR